MKSQVASLLESNERVKWHTFTTVECRISAKVYGQFDQVRPIKCNWAVNKEVTYLPSQTTCLLWSTIDTTKSTLYHSNYPTGPFQI